MPRNLAGFDPIYELASEHGAAMLAGSENAFEPSAPDSQREAHDEFTKMVRDNPHLERFAQWYFPARMSVFFPQR